MSKGKILLIGIGNMGRAYAQILSDQKREFIAVANTDTNAANFKAQFDVDLLVGGVNKVDTAALGISHAIIASPLHTLADCTRDLIRKKVPNILVEKPGALSVQELQDLKPQVSGDSNIYIAYNRRFYDSVQAAKTIISEDGGAISANIEFSEFSHAISKIGHREDVLRNWIFVNSTHVIDTLFFLIGKPKTLSSTVHGTSNWGTPQQLSGHGMSVNNTFFNYFAELSSAPRWQIVINTRKRALLLNPLEILKARKIDSLKDEEISLTPNPNDTYKPGLLGQLEAFLSTTKQNDLPSLSEKIEDGAYLRALLEGLDYNVDA